MAGALCSGHFRLGKKDRQLKQRGSPHGLAHLSTACVMTQEDLAQVNTQLHEWLNIVNAISSEESDSIRDRKPLYGDRFDGIALPIL